MGGVAPEGKFLLSRTLLVTPPQLCSIVWKQGDAECSPPTPWAKCTLRYCSSVMGDRRVVRGGLGRQSDGCRGIGQRTGGGGLRVGLVMGLDILDGWRVGVQLRG